MFRAVVLVGVLALIVAALSWPGPGVLVPVRDAYSAAAWWVLIGSAALALLRPRVLRYAAVALAATGWVLLVPAALAVVGTGLPTAALGVLVAGGVVTGLGVLGRAAADRPMSWWRAAAASAAAALVVVGLTLAVDTGAWRHPVVAVTAAPGGPPPAVVTRPVAIRWTWRDPVGTASVLPGGPGVVVARRDGVVVGLDGRTGTPRWWAGRAGSSAAVTVTSDRRHVVVVQTAGRGHADEGGRALSRLTVLDADTGAVRWESDGGLWTALADDVVLVGTVARSLDDGRVRWTVPPPPPACRLDGRGIVAARVVAVGVSCTGSASVQAYDAATGVVRWRTASPDLTPARLIGSTLLTAPDGGVLAWRATTAESDPGGAGGFTVLLDPDSGRVLARPDREFVRLATSSRPVLRPATTGDLEPPPDAALTPTGVVPLPPTTCAATVLLSVVATPDATVRVCAGTTSRTPLLALDGGPPGPLPIDAGRYRDVTGDVADTPEPGHPEAFAVAAPGAFVVGVRQEEGSTLVGFGG